MGTKFDPGFPSDRNGGVATRLEAEIAEIVNDVETRGNVVVGGVLRLYTWPTFKWCRLRLLVGLSPTPLSTTFFLSIDRKETPLKKKRGLVRVTKKGSPVKKRFGDSF